MNKKQIIGGVVVIAVIVLAGFGIKSVMMKKQAPSTNPEGQGQTVNDVNKPSPSQTDPSKADGNPVAQDGSVVNPSEAFVRSYNDGREGKAVATAFDLLALSDIKRSPIKSIDDITIPASVDTSFYNPQNRPVMQITAFDDTVKRAIEFIHYPGVKIERVGLIIPLRSKSKDSNVSSGANPNIQLIQTEGLLRATSPSGSVLYDRITIEGSVNIPNNGDAYKLGNDFKVVDLRVINPKEISDSELQNIFKRYYAQ